MPVDIILYALIAVGLVFWLRSLLGMRQDGDRQRPNPFLETDAPTSLKTGQPGAKTPQQPAIAGLLGKPKQALLPDGTVDIAAGLAKHMNLADAARPGLMEIVRNDRGFEAGHFLTGAQDAFVMIVEAFAASDREQLKPLLSDALYSAFDSAIVNREAAGEKGSVEIHAVRRAEILAAWMTGRTAFVTVRFVADETNVLRGPDDAILSGHPDRVTETIDIWTFSRDTRSRQPGWLLTETREEQTDQPTHIVPDAGPSAPPAL